MGTLAIGVAARERLAALALAGYPEEACGLLLGAADRVSEVWLLRNAAADRRRHFQFDALEYMQAERLADSAGLRVLGVWHSHPDAAPEPSAMDKQEAWPGWSYVIVGTSTDGVTGIRSWRLAGGDFVEEVIQS